MYAGISPQTVSSWERSTSREPEAVLNGREKRVGISYLQLVEIAVVAAMRKSGVSLREIKEARKYLKVRWAEDFPFARMKFKTDGVDVLLDYEAEDRKVLADRLVSANRSGQLIWTDMLSDRLLEFDYDKSGLVRSWYVMGRNKDVSIDPSIAFGAPNVDGVATRIIKDHWSAGQSVEQISDDFELQAELVSQALEFEGIAKEVQAKRWIN
jgi:uncharacterized protein (DUF433 family)